MKFTYNNVYLYNGDCRNVFKGIDSETGKRFGRASDMVERIELYAL